MKGNHKISIKGTMVDSLKRELRDVEIFVSDGVIKKIVDCSETGLPFIVPGFVDAHVHIESSMLVPSSFARMAVKQGTVAVVTDPHEVANVAGVDGIRFMQKNAAEVPVKFFFGVPSCVPASPLEKSGALIDSNVVKELLNDKSFLFLAEMMNFPGVIYDDPEVRRKIDAAVAAKKPIDGHAPGLTGENLRKYAKVGITTDHECSTIDEAIEKINLGMKILIREGSAAKNFKNLIPLMNNYPQSVMFCTDDCHPDYLEKGHINKIVSRAVGEGYDLYDTIMAASINPIMHYNLPVGILRVGDPAEFVVVNNLTQFDVLETYINGERVYSHGKVSFAHPEVVKPTFSFRSQYTIPDLSVIATTNKMNVIGAIEDELLTRWLVEPTGVTPGNEVKSNPSSDLLKIVLLDRYTNDPPVIAFIKGFGLKYGAIAASIAHDSHHILSIGCDDESIKTALEWIIKNRGGLCFSSAKKAQGIPLPFYGLMTNSDGEDISSKYKMLNQLVLENGCTLTAPFMTASFMALTVIPELKIYHKGLFDGIAFKHVDLFS